jgi:hypothetical protein
MQSALKAKHQFVTQTDPIINQSINHEFTKRKTHKKQIKKRP